MTVPSFTMTFCTLIISCLFIGYGIDHNRWIFILPGMGIFIFYITLVFAIARLLSCSNVKELGK